MNAEQNYRLLQGIDANRRFLLQAYRDNPDLQSRAEPEVRRLLDAARADMPGAEQTTLLSTTSGGPPAPTIEPVSGTEKRITP
jgi:hypothetical protein